MKSDNRHLRPSPLLIVLTTAVVVIIIVLLFGWLSARRYRVKARVEIADPTVDARALSAPAPPEHLTLPDGEAPRTAARVREAAGLLTGLALLTLSEQMSHRNPPNADALIELMARRSLLPPGVARTQSSGLLASAHATIQFRYRPQPPGLEVISIGRERLDGPAVIARLAVGADDESGAALLIAGRIDHVAPPQPFAPLAQLIAQGWSVESWGERAFAPQEIEQWNTWARQFASAH